MGIFRKVLLFFGYLIFFSCSVSVRNSEDMGVLPDIFPDYINVTVPANIAPLNFCCRGTQSRGILLIEGRQDSIKVSSSGKFSIPRHKWQKLLEENKGGEIKLTVFTKNGDVWKKYKPFFIAIAPEPIDPYIAYRLIEPGYSAWDKMGIYQRDIEGYHESPVYENRVSNFNCVNCHSFCMQDPGQMLFHVRGGPNAGTILIKEEKTGKLNTKADTVHSPLVYPSWHPSGKYVAFSVNKTRQVFYANNRDRVEVFDSKSDVVIYDIGKHEVFTTPLLSSENAFETFPSFSPDGKILYYCSAKALTVPEKIDSVKYNLCSVSFDSERRTFGEKADTIYNVKISGGSAAFPRVSPDGEYLLFTLSEFGNFHIWHKDADLYLMDLKTGKYVDMQSVNSNDVESYHSWSSNSRWFVFGSRRMDGLYTRLYIAYLDNKGKTGKAFLLPQKDPEYYDRLMKSYNIPEMIKGKVEINSYDIVNHTR